MDRNVTVANSVQAEQLESRRMRSFTLNYDTPTSTYTATDNGGVSGAHFVTYVSAGKGFLSEKDGSGTVVQSANLGATGLQHLVLNINPSGQASYVSDSTVPATLANGAATRIDINGGSGRDVIYGGAELNVINGNAGNDTVIGGGGNDTLHGNDGNDGVDGGDGNDYLFGDAGLNDINGAQYNDGNGADRIYVNADASDYVYANGAANADGPKGSDGSPDRISAYLSDTTSQFFYDPDEGDTLTRQ